MQQTAWLNAIPKTDTSLSRAHDLSKTMTRLQQIQSRGLAPDLPAAGPAAHLVGYLFDCGPIQYGAMGEAPLSHTDIAAWQANTGVALQTWEALSLRRLSRAYLASLQAAREADCPPPYVTPTTEASRNAVDQAVRAIFGNRKVH